MRVHRQVPADFLEAVGFPTGNVRVLPPQHRPDGEDPRPEPASVEHRANPEGTEPGWVIHDGDGGTLQPALSSRAEALRRIGVLAFHGASLPLTVHAPNGEPTGDRLG